MQPLLVVKIKLNYLLPFLYDNNWRTSSREISNLQKTFMFVTLKPGESINLFYKDKTRLILKIISIFSFVFVEIASNTL